jgi:glutaconate CoA-transferase subunit A
VVEGDDFVKAPESVSISGFMVDAVVEAPGGAWPGGCAGLYDYDADYLAAYVAASKHDDTLRQFIAEHILDPSLAVAGR